MVLRNARFRKFLSYFHPYKGLLAADVACALASAGIALLIPLGIRAITGQLALRADYAGIYRTGAFLAFLALAQVACSYFFDYKGHAMGAMMERDLRNELFAHYQRQSFSFFDDQRVGKLMSGLTSDLLNLAELYHHGPEDLAVYLVKFIGALWILLGINRPLTVVMLCFLPLAAVFTLIFGKRLNRAFAVSLQRIADVQGRAEESLSGVRVVQAYNAQAQEDEKFRAENQAYLGSRVAIYKGEAVFYNGLQLLGQLLTIALGVFGGLAILGGGLSLADLVAFLLYANYLVEPMTKLSHIITQYQEGIAGFNRFCDIVEEEPSIQDAPDAVDLPDARGEVRFEGVSFRYKEGLEHVLKGISLTANPGETLAIVGYSGVGKTTLCALIPRFYDVSAGSVSIDGLDVRKIRLASLRALVGVVQQDTYLFSGSVLENIRYGRPEAEPAQVVEAAKKAHAHAFIEALPSGYQTDIGYKGVKLSGGQRQRISIARAFLMDPRILILDEATSALDSESEALVQSSLSELSKNRTTFVIAHRQSTIEHADRVLELTGEGIAERKG